MEDLFREMTTAELRELLVERGLTNIEIGDSLRIIDEIRVLSDGKKPVYVISLDGVPDNDTIKYLMSEFVAINIAAILIPSKRIVFEGAVV
jgi:hypothetical protein